MRRLKRLGALMSAATVMTVLATGIAWSDDGFIDGDAAATGANPLAFGNVCASTTVNKDVAFAIERTTGGAANTFKNSSGAAVSVALKSGGTGTVSATLPPLVSGFNFTVPSNWQSQAVGAISPSIASTVTFAAGAAGTSLSRTLRYTILGTDASNGALSRTVELPVTATVVNCDTTAPTLNLPTNQTLEATGPGGRAVSFTATASDADPASPAVTCSPASGATFPIGTTTVECSATDAAGNTANGSFSITVQDTTAPSFGAPSDVVAEASGPNGATVTFTDPVATDLVDGTRPVTCSPASGSVFPLGASSVTCSASDTRGNAGSTGFSVTVSDTTDPTLVLPTTVTEEAASGAGAAVDYAGQVSATDAVDQAVAPQCTPPSGSTFGLGSTTVECTATDASGNSTSGSFAVVVEDTTAPVVTVPGSFTTEATSASGAAVDFAASASDLVDGALTPECTSASGSTFPIGETTVTCSVTDAAGNPGSASFVITVADTTGPTLSLPADITEEGDQLGGRVVTFSPTASDAVDGAVSVDCLPVSGSLFEVGSTLVTCTATDAHGNPSAGSFSVTITDTTAPVVDVPDDVVVEATGPTGAVVDFGAVSAEDLVDGGQAADCAPSTNSTFALGTTEVTCSATDAAGNTGSDTFTVTVQDTTAPAISGTPTDFEVEATGPTGATATYSNPTGDDIVDGAVEVTCDPASGSAFALDQSTLVTCTATDATGNTASSTFSVLVSDRTDPVLSLPADVTAEASGPDGAVVEYVASASDVVDLTVPVTCEPPSESLFALGATPVACSATDAHGNTADGGFTITVVDTTPPAVTVPDPITAEATGPTGAAVTYPASALDIVDGAVEVTCDTPSGATFALGETQVTCAAEDAAGNSATEDFTVTVEDTTAPVLALPDPITEEATSAAGATVAFTATSTDLVDLTVPVTCVPAAGVFPLGTTTVSCSATDAAGNTATGSFTVTVQDTTAPDVTVPDDATVEATSAAGAVVTFESSSTDAVDGPGTPTCDPSSGATFPLGATTVTCAITDAAGNEGSADFTITVVDTTGPEISGTPTNLDQNEATGPAGAVVTYDDPTAYDLVDGVVAVTCAPPSGSVFALGTTAVTCAAEDSRQNSSTSGFSVTVSDTTAPTLTLPGAITEEATGPEGAVVPFAASASDLVDGSVAVTCDPSSGSTFGIGTTTVDCSTADWRGNASSGSFTVTVEDTTAPALTLPADMTVEATGPSGAVATFSTSAVDIVDGPLAPTCDATSGATFALGTTTVTCSVTDDAGNTATDSFTILVRDTTAPTLVLPSNLTRTATGATGAPVSFTASATDIVDGSPAVTCTPASGATFGAGTQTVSCQSTDAAGNTATGSFTVTVVFDLSGGLLQPVNPNALNTVKGGSTVPLKFQVRTASGGYISSLSVISGFLLTQVQCGSLTTDLDPVDFTTTGGTTLRYDTASNQYIQNWQTPKQPGKCFRVDIAFVGGQRLTANFQLK